LQIWELVDRIVKREPAVCKHQGMFIVNKEGNLKSIITSGDMLRALDKDPAGAMSVIEAGTRDVLVTYPDELLHDAAAKMLRSNLGRLPVVDRDHSRRIIGYLGR